MCQDEFTLLKLGTSIFFDTFDTALEEVAQLWCWWFAVAAYLAFIRLKGSGQSTNMCATNVESKWAMKKTLVGWVI